MRPVAVDDFCAVEARATTDTLRVVRAARAGATARFCFVCVFVVCRDGVEGRNRKRG